MAHKLQILDEAILEIDEAIECYKAISHNLSGDLQMKILEALEWILKNPEAIPPIRAGYRKVNLQRFPYKIVYRVKDETVVVVARQHHKRKPFHWKGR